jgi:hypothetical protein
MPEERMVKKVYKWRPMLRRSLGRPKNRWEDDIRNELRGALCFLTIKCTKISSTI